MKTDLLRKKHFHLLATVFIIGVCVYSNTFHVPFLFDDESSITDNPVIKHLGNFFSGSGYEYNPRRFIGYLTFALNYRLEGLGVTSYHLFNLAVHITAALLVYTLGILTFRTPYLKTSPLSSKSRSIAFFAALIFVVHPVQTEAVTYIVQRFASLAAMFYLASLVLYIRARLFLEDGARSRGAVIYLLSIMAALLAMKTKEIAFTLPLVAALYEFSFFRGNVRGRILFLLPLLATLLIVPLSIMGELKPVGELLSDLSEKARADRILPRWDYLVTQFRVIVTYLRLLFLPMRQNLDYDYPIYHSLFSPQVFLSFLLLTAMIGTAVCLFFRSRRSDGSSSRLVAFGISWFFITLAVESSLIPIRDVIFEHRVYLPSAGFILALVTLVFGGAGKLRNRIPATEKWAVSALLLGAVLLSAATYARNSVWRDGTTLWRDVTEKSPLKPRPHYNLGQALDKQGRFEEAVGEYLTAIQLDPAFADAHYNLGLIYIRFGRIPDAIGEFSISIRLEPGYADAHYNLANAYLEMGKLEEATDNYLAALSLKPDYADAYCNLGTVYAQKGDLDRAVEAFAASLRISPNNVMARSNIATAYFKLGRLEQAAKEYRTVLMLNPGDAKALHALREIEHRSKSIR